MSTAYANAIRAMNDIGKVTNSDKEAGYVNGSSRSGVDIVATITQTPDGSVKVNAKGTLPAGKVDLPGVVPKAVDEFLAAYNKYSQ
jgi:hypothetical protein